MRIFKASLILRKVIGLTHLANVMKERTCPAQDWIGLHGQGGVFGQVGNHKAVMVSTGSFHLHSPKQGMVEVR